MRSFKPPTSDEINALPENIRLWVHDLETRCDPSGELRELMQGRETIRELEDYLLKILLISDKFLYYGVEFAHTRETGWTRSRLQRKIIRRTSRGI